MIKKADWLAIAKDRTAVMLLLGVAITCIVLIITTVLRVHPSDIQIPVRYTGFGQTFIYRDQWYTQYAYMLFAVLIATVNVFLSIRMYNLRRLLGLGLLGMSIFLVVIATIISNAIFNLAPSV